MDITKITVLIIALILAVIEATVIPMIKAKVSRAQLENALIYVHMAVEAVEQMHIGESGVGAIKKQEVLDYLESKNIKLDTATLDKAIEAAVLELNNALLAS